MANDWHLVHLGKFAQGGAGIVFTEAAAVQRRGRITHGDLGIWSDAHGQALAATTAFIRSMGSTSAIQLAHAGRKASMQRPWHGNGPLNNDDRERGEEPWSVIAPSSEPLGEGWLVPSQMSRADIAQVIDDFASAAVRSHAAGFDIVEVHAAHGYLAASFLSPVSNHRQDEYGGNRFRPIDPDPPALKQINQMIKLRICTFDGRQRSRAPHAAHITVFGYFCFRRGLGRGNTCKVSPTYNDMLKRIKIIP